jgi:hypothetical protein
MSYLPEDYEQVEDRIRKFYSDHPQGRITTTMLERGQMEVVFRAQVFRELDLDPHPAATGHAHGFLGQPKDLEKTETVAIGRALANLNYAKQGRRMSREEAQAFEETKTMHPVGHATGPLATQRATAPATPAQIKLAKDLLAQVDDGVTIVAEHLGGYRPPEVWTKYEASGDKGSNNGLIDKLIAAKEAQMGGRRPSRSKANIDNDDPWHMREAPDE